MESSRPRLIRDLSSGWSFVPRRMGRRWMRGLASDPSDAEPVTLPHCWNAVDTFSEGVSYRRGAGSYRLRFPAERDAAAAGPVRWRIETDGFYGVGDLWLNGARLGPIDGQYLGLRLDVTDRLGFDEDNLLSVRLTNRCPAHVLPGLPDPDFLLYGGLSGAVRLVRFPAAHLSEETVFIRCLSVQPRAARLRIEYTAHLPPTAPADMWETTWRIVAPDGSVAAEESDRPDRSGVSVLEATVPEPGLWSPARPGLYAAEGTLRAGKEIVDRIRIRFGIRDARFEPDRGFFLNGERLDLRGVNRHEDMPGFGRALPRALHRADAEAIRRAGLNFVRLSHYPQHPAFLAACDELGVLVYAEIATWKSVRRGRWLKNAARQMQGMIERDRNHPSVILWGMGNESRDRVAYRTLQNLVRRLDPTRPTIYAENHLYRARRKHTYGLPDVWGLNYEMECLEEVRDGARLRTVVVSECSNRPDTARGWAERERAQVETIEQDLEGLESRPYVAGFALWCLNDYATLRKRRYRRFSGLYDAWRMPKAAVYGLRARYAEEPVLVLAGAWGEGYPADVEMGVLDAFSNCTEVRVLAGDREIWSGPGRGHVTFRADTVGEDLLALGRNGSEECRYSFPWHGAATRLSVRAEPEIEPEEETGRRICAFRVAALDARGNLARSWSGAVTVRAEGALRLCPWRADGQWILAGGQARVYAWAEVGEKPYRLSVSHPALAGGSARG